MTEDIKQKAREYYEQKLQECGVPYHMHGGFVRYLVDFIEPGDFMLAVLRNQLTESFGRADDMNRKHMFEIATFVYEYVPMAARGNNVESWLAQRKVTADV